MPRPAPHHARRRRPGLEQLPARGRPRRRATRSSGSTRGARRCASVPASTQRPADRRRAARGPRVPRALRASGCGLASFGGARRGHATRFASATNAAAFLPQAERALGFPIDIISGHEEARLIYLGVAHVLPPSDAPRLVIDIGGGSTEFIIGRGIEPERLESLKIGCVGMTQRFFADGRADDGRVRCGGDRCARGDRGDRAASSIATHWHEAYASSGTALALAEILEQNGLSSGGITPRGPRPAAPADDDAGHVSTSAAEGVEAGARAGARRRLRDHGRRAGRARRRAHRPGRRRAAARRSLRPARAHRSTRQPRRDRRAVHRALPHRSRARAARGGDSRRRSTSAPLLAADREVAQRVEWAALLHEVGFSVSHIGFHKHGAYILQNADMPGFSAGEQDSIARLVLGLPRRSRRR